MHSKSSLLNQDQQLYLITKYKKIYFKNKCSKLVNRFLVKFKLFT